MNTVRPFILKKKKIILFIINLILVLFILSNFLFFSQAQAVWHDMPRAASLENISNNSGNSLIPQIQLDAFSNPFVVWRDQATGNGDIYFKKWDAVSNSWTKMDGTAGFDNLSDNSGTSDNPQIILSSANDPYVAWEDSSTGNGDIYFTYWDGAKWAKLSDGTAGYDNLSNNSGISRYSRIQLDSANNPFVVWEDQTTGSGDIYFIRWKPGTGWTKMDSTLDYENISNNSFDSVNPEMHLDKNNKPYIIWEDGTTGDGDIYFTFWDGAKWAKLSDDSAGYDNLSNNVGDSEIFLNLTTFVLDSKNNPYVVWHDYTPGHPNADVYFTKWTPGVGWTQMDGITPGHDDLSNNIGTSGVAQIQLDTNNNPYVVWHDSTTGNFEIYFSKWTPGVGWTQMDGVTSGYENLSNNSGGSGYPIIKLSSANNPYVSWLDETIMGGAIYDIYFKKWTPGVGWTKMDGLTSGTENITHNSSQSEGIFILNNINFPYFVWEDDISGNFEIYFTRWILEEQGQIIISASVDPSLTLTLSSTTCSLGTFDATKVNTCQYNATVTTNASSGYTAYIRDDGKLRNATNDINNVAGGQTDPGSEEYGVATSSAAGGLDITATESGVDCATANGGASAVNALALTTSDQSYAKATAPISADVTTLCHSATIAGATPAGAYAQTVTITVVGNF